MPTKQRKQKIRKQKYYQKHQKPTLARLKARYNSNGVSQRKYSREYHSQHKSRRNAASQKYYDSHKDDRIQSYMKYYACHLEQRKAASKQHRAYNLKAYNHNYYQTNKARITAARQKYYASHRSQVIAAVRARKLKKAKQIVSRASKYYTKNREFICSDRKRRYHLAELKPYVKSLYITKLCKLAAKKSDLYQAFHNQHERVALDMTRAQGKRAACSIAATRVVNKVLKIRKLHVGVLLKALRESAS